MPNVKLLEVPPIASEANTFKPENAIESLREAASEIVAFWAGYFGRTRQSEMHAAGVTSHEQTVTNMLTNLLEHHYGIALFPVGEELSDAESGTPPIFTAVGYIDHEREAELPLVLDADGSTIDVLEFCKQVTETELCPIFVTDISSGRTSSSEAE